jgi:putative ABC transport system permease protein
MYIKPNFLQARLLRFFTFISLFIFHLRLLNLSLLIAQQKIKEIGIRKVNDAHISEVLIMLNRDFIMCIAIAFGFASSIAYFAMQKRLENFAY